MNRISALVRAQHDASRAIELLQRFPPTHEEYMAALDRLNAVHAALSAVPGEIDTYVAAEVAATEEALDPVITQIEDDQAAITEKLAASQAASATSSTAAVDPLTGLAAAGQ
jgi:hypothetical protein